MPRKGNVPMSPPVNNRQISKRGLGSPFHLAPSSRI